MEHSVKYKFLMSQLTPVRDIEDTEKTKISLVVREGCEAPCVLRVCKGRDLSDVCSALRGIRDPNTAVVYDFVYENGDTYVLEEFVDGRTVAEMIEAEGPLSEKRTAEIVLAVCRALEMLHGQRPPVVHNDINPSNIKIRDDGSVKLFDFDISRRYKRGQSQNTELFGTEEYAAPEHFGYGQSEPRTDIYSLGVTMHKMLTGCSLSPEHRTAYTGKLAGIVKRCLAFDPKDRYPSVLALRRDLERFLTRKRRALRGAAWTLCAAAVIAAALLCMSVLKNGTSDAQGGADAGQTQTGGGSVDGSVTDGKTPSDNAAADSDRDEDDGESAGEDTSGEEDVTQTEPPNDSRETAKTVALAQRQHGRLDGQTAAWYRFDASAALAAYRIELIPTEVPNEAAPSLPYLFVTLYDSLGIKREELFLESGDGEAYAFLDAYLAQGEEYFLQVTLGEDFSAAEYDVCVMALPVDAGTDKASATEITLDLMHAAEITCTLSDWYVFRAPEAGDYTYTVHNIDVGYEIAFSLSNGTRWYVDSGDNYVGVLHSLSVGDSIYFEIYAKGGEPRASGSYAIVLEKID